MKLLLPLRLQLRWPQDGLCDQRRRGRVWYRRGFRRGRGHLTKRPRICPTPLHLRSLPPVVRHRVAQDGFFESVIVLALPSGVGLRVWQREDAGVVVSGLDERARMRTLRQLPDLVEAHVITQCGLGNNEGRRRCWTTVDMHL